MRMDIDHPTGQANFAIVTLETDNGFIRIGFSYKTVIGVNLGDGLGWRLRENVWGPTTGRHLNELSRTAPRLGETEFAAILERVPMVLLGVPSQ